MEIEIRAKLAAEQIMFHAARSTLSETQAEVIILDHFRVIDAINATESVLYPSAPYEIKRQDDFYSGCAAYRNALRQHIFNKEKLRGERTSTANASQNTAAAPAPARHTSPLPEAGNG
jgi:hypothetical protein